MYTALLAATAMLTVPISQGYVLLEVISLSAQL